MTKDGVEFSSSIEGSKFKGFSSVKAFTWAFLKLRSTFCRFWKSFEQTRCLNNGQLGFSSQSPLYLLLDDCGNVLTKMSISVFNLHHPRHHIFSCLVLLSVFLSLMKSLLSSKGIFEAKASGFFSQVEAFQTRPISRLCSPELVLDDLYSISWSRRFASGSPPDTLSNFMFSMNDTKASILSFKARSVTSSILSPTGEFAKKMISAKLRQVIPVVLNDTNK